MAAQIISAIPHLHFCITAMLFANEAHLKKIIPRGEVGQCLGHTAVGDLRKTNINKSEKQRENEETSKRQNKRGKDTLREV